MRSCALTDNHAAAAGLVVELVEVQRDLLEELGGHFPRSLVLPLSFVGTTRFQESSKL